MLQLFFKKRVLDEPAYILFIRQNALQILIPKFGLEGTVFLTDGTNKSLFTYSEEVRFSVYEVYIMLLYIILLHL